jgi:hypothetical protein
MPGNDDIVVIKIPGLCIGGRGGAGMSTEVGYVCFMKKGVGAKKKTFAYYQKPILIPLINDTRKVIDPEFDAKDPELTAVYWCDGDLSQVHTITNDAKLF